MGLKNCIERAGKLIPPAHADRMLARAAALEAEGVPAETAAQTAVRETLAVVQAEKEKLEGTPTPPQLPQPPTEQVSLAAIRTESGQIYVGRTHAEAIGLAADNGVEIDETIETGFTTSTGRFIDRAEALKLAVDTEQIPGRFRALADAGLGLEAITFNRIVRASIGQPLTEGGEGDAEVQRQGEETLRTTLTSPERLAEERRLLERGPTQFLRQVALSGVLLQDELGGKGFLYRSWAKHMQDRYGPAITEFLPRAWAQVEDARFSIGEPAGWDELSRYLTPEEEELLGARAQKNFVDIFQMLAPTEEMASVALAGKVKKGWYKTSAQAIFDIFGGDAPRFAALLAALSPRTSVKSNLTNTLNIWAGWIEAGRPTDEAAILRIMKQETPGDSGDFEAWQGNTVAALSSDDPVNLRLSGPKVNSFMANLRNVVNEVTNDAWMAGFHLVHQKLFSGMKRVATGDRGVKGAGYIAANVATRKTAEYLTQMTGETWTPAEVQETIWSWAKALYELAGRSRMPTQVLGELTQETIYDTPDFAILLTQPGYREALARSGYSPAQPVARPDLGPRRATQREIRKVDPGLQHLARAAARLDNLKRFRKARSLIDGPLEKALATAKKLKDAGKEVPAALQNRIARLKLRLKKFDAKLRGIESPDFSQVRASIGAAVTPTDLGSALDDLRREFPSAPEFRVSTSTPGAAAAGFSWEDQQLGAVYRAGAIHIFPSYLGDRGQVRNAVLGALAESGVDIFPETTWAKLYVLARATNPNGLNRAAAAMRADLTDPAQRPAVLARMVRDSAEEGRLSSLGRRIIRLLRGSQTRQYMRLLRQITDGVLEAYRPTTPLPPGEELWVGIRSNGDRQLFPTQAEAVAYAGSDGVARDARQDRAFADLHGAWWRVAQPVLEDLRSQASELGVAAKDDDLWSRLTGYLNKVARDAEAAVLGETAGRIRLSPTSREFVDQVRSTPLVLSASEWSRLEDAHTRFLAERDARALLKLMDRRDALVQARDSLHRLEPRWGSDEMKPDRDRLDTQITRLSRRIDRASDALRARAGEIREQQLAIPRARAAELVLADPFWAEAAEVIDRIAESGVHPRDPAAMPTETRRTSEAHANLFYNAYQSFRTRIVKEHGIAGPRLEASLRLLRKRLEDARTSAAEAEIAVKEVRDTLIGTPGTSGSLGSREAAEAMRDLDVAVMRFAIALAGSRPDTPVGDLRDAIAGMGAISGIDVRSIAAATGLSEDTFSRILDLIQHYDAFRNGVLAMHDAAQREILGATITSILAIESLRASGSEEEIRTAHRVAAEAIARLRQSWRRARGIESSVSADIEEALVKQLALDTLLASSAYPVPDSGAIREMVYPINDGYYLPGFTRADGNPQPELWVKPGETYGPNELAKLVEWREQARQAAAASTNDPETTRGLAVAIDESAKFIDLYSTPSMFGKTLAPGRLLTALARPPGASISLQLKSTLPKLLPGIFGNLLATAEAKYVKAAQEVDMLLDKHLKRQRQLLDSAARSMGIDMNVAGEASRFWMAYNEVAHRLRQFGSGVSSGDRLWRSSVRGAEITPEMLTYVRFHRDVFREAQRIVGAEPYGGIRMKRPGRSVVRAPVETGDVGLGRLADPTRYRKLSSVYEKADGRPDAPEVIQFWEDDPDAVLAHVQDSNRTDLGTDRDPTLLRAEQSLARALTAAWTTPVPQTISEWVDALIPHMPPIADVATYVRTALLNELAEYGNVARAKVKTDQDRARARTAGKYFGEDDINEFSSPAAKLSFPSSWYNYGAADGFRAALERIADRRQTEYFAALMNAAAELRSRANTLSTDIAQSTPTDNRIERHREEILWHTKGIWDSSDPAIDRARADAAVKIMRDRASAIEGALAFVANIRSRGIAGRALQTIYTLVLSYVTPAVTNTVGGPMAQFPILRPLIGTGPATVVTSLSVGVSVANAITEMLVSIVPARIRPRFSTREAMIDWLLSKGLGSSYSREELGEMEQWESGLAARRSTGSRIRGAAAQVGEVIGVQLGDKLLNRYAARFLVPMVIWRLKTISNAWQRRIGGAANYDPTKADTLLSEKDTAFFARIREMLRPLGLPAEEVLLRLTGVGASETNPRLFWRTGEGSAIGDWILNEFNVATRTNRPPSSTLLGLLGWAAKMSTSLVEDMRSTPDDATLKRMWRGTTWALAAGLTSMVAAFAANYARRGVNEGITYLAQQLSDLLAPDEDDDEHGLFDSIMAALSRVVGAWRTYNVPEPGPLETAFWKNSGPDGVPGTGDDQFRDYGELGLSLAQAAASGIGLDFRNGFRMPAVSFGYQLSRGMTQAGRGAVMAAEGLARKDASKMAGAEADVREGTRQIASSLSIWGRLPFNILFPEDQAGRESKQKIVRAANDLGIPRAEVPPLTSFLSPTPVRRDLQFAGRRIVDGDPNAAEDARNIAAFIWNRSYERAIRAGDSAEVARKSADAAVKRNLAGLNPYESALGRSISQEQYDRLKTMVGNDPAVLRDEAAANAVIEAIRAKPPAGMKPFAPTRAMISPVKEESGGGGRTVWVGGEGLSRISRRSSVGGRRIPRLRLRRGRISTRRSRLPRIGKRVRWA